MIIIMILIVLTLSPKVLAFAMNVNSRANEFAADRYAVNLGYGKELASGLIKISIGKSTT